MICVSLGRTRHSMVAAEHQALAQRGVQLVELRLDWIARDPDLTRLLHGRPTPVIVTCRRPVDGGKWRGHEEERLTLLRQAIVSGADYVDIEMDVATKIRRFGPTKRIISYHDFRSTPDNLEEIFEELCQLDGDIFKIVTMAEKPEDNVRLLKLIQKAPKPTLAFCMGEFGLMSRVLCGKFGAPFTYATFNPDRVLAPGQLSFDEMHGLYHYNAINAETRVFGVLGDPIAQSYSPLIHNSAFMHDGVNAVYLPLRVPADELGDALLAYNDLGIEGYSVTIPHKESIRGLATYKEDIVDDIGAANTLYKDPRGRWHAANTDYEAALSALHQGLQLKGDTELAGKRVLILGCGGVAKAIGLGVSRAGAAVTVTNRTKARGVALAEQLNCQYVGWENRGSVFADILVNCTPVGMYPNMDDTPFTQNWLREGMFVFDTIYNPENTLLLKQARDRGCFTVSGLEMFVLQAAAQYQCFTGRAAPLEVMRDALRRGINPVRVKDLPTGEA